MTTETVGERISALEAKRAANLARMNAMSDDAGKKGETLDDSQADEYDGLEREIETNVASGFTVRAAKQAGFDHCVDKVDAIGSLQQLFENDV